MSFSGSKNSRVYQKKTGPSTDHYVDRKSTATDTSESRRTHPIHLSNTSSLAASSTINAKTGSSITAKCDSCNVSDARKYYNWELVDANVLQTALNFREELIPWQNDNKKLKNKIYTIIKGYLTLHLHNMIEKEPLNHTTEDKQIDPIAQKEAQQKQIDEVRNFFKQAMHECNPIYIIKAYSIHQNFTKLLNNDMARIILHDINQACSKFSCDTLYTTQDGTKSIASIFFYHSGFTTYAGTVYRGVFAPLDLEKVQVNRCIMTTTFLSTSKQEGVADMFAGYDRDKKKLDRDCKEGEVSVGYTFIVKNINGNRRALDISSISERSHEEEVLLLPYSVFLVIKREIITLQNNKGTRIEIELEECDQAQLRESLNYQ